MQALIVNDDPTEAQRIAATLSRRGFMVHRLSGQAEAATYVRRTVVDLLVLKQIIDGRHTTSVALLGELHHPGMATILLSPRRREDALELFELIPSLQAVLGEKPDDQLLGAIAVEAVSATVTPVLVLAPEKRVHAGAIRPSGAPGFVSRRHHAA